MLDWENGSSFCHNLRSCMCHKNQLKVKLWQTFSQSAPMPKYLQLKDDLVDESVYNVETSTPKTSWDIYFDAATKTNEKGKLISGVGILFVSLDRYMIPHAF